MNVLHSTNFQPQVLDPSTIDYPSASPPESTTNFSEALGFLSETPNTIGVNDDAVGHFSVTMGLSQALEQPTNISVKETLAESHEISEKLHTTEVDRSPDNILDNSIRQTADAVTPKSSIDYFGDEARDVRNTAQSANLVIGKGMHLASQSPKDGASEATKKTKGLELERSLYAGPQLVGKPSAADRMGQQLPLMKQEHFAAKPTNFLGQKNQQSSDLPVENDWTNKDTISVRQKEKPNEALIATVRSADGNGRTHPTFGYSPSNAIQQTFEHASVAQGSSANQSWVAKDTGQSFNKVHAKLAPTRQVEVAKSLEAMPFNLAVEAEGTRLSHMRAVEPLLVGTGATSHASPTEAAAKAPVSVQTGLEVLIKTFTMNGDQKSQEFEVRLDPEELGKVRININQRETGLHITFAVERFETLDILKRNADMLLGQLQDINLDDAKLEFGWEQPNYHAASEDRENSEEEDFVPEADISIVRLMGMDETGRLDMRL